MECTSCLCCMVIMCFINHTTAYELRISDWSSAVCSSDLNRRLVLIDDPHLEAGLRSIFRAADLHRDFEFGVRVGGVDAALIVSEIDLRTRVDLHAKQGHAHEGYARMGPGIEEQPAANADIGGAEQRVESIIAKLEQRGAQLDRAGNRRDRKSTRLNSRPQSATRMP